MPAKMPVLLCLLFLGSSFSIPVHGIYIGTIKISHQEEKEHTTMEVKVFSDDLQNALKDEYQLAYLPKVLTICRDSTNTLQAYFDQHLQVWINGHKADFKLSDCQLINDVHLLQFQIGSPAEWKELKVNANFFMELFPTQSNVLQVHYKKDKSTASFSRFGRMTQGKETLQLNF